MRHFATALYAGVTATVLIGGAVLTSTPPRRPRELPNVEKGCPKRGDRCVQGGGQGEEDKRVQPSRKYVSNCVAGTVKLTPEELQKIAVKQAIVACKAEAKGKKIRWPASRKFVSSCLSNALKDYHLDVALLRSELNMAGLRRYTPEETGCLQNVYCEEQ